MAKRWCVILECPICRFLFQTTIQMNSPEVGDSYLYFCPTCGKTRRFRLVKVGGDDNV